MRANEKGPDESGPIGSNLNHALKWAPMLLLFLSRRLLLRSGFLRCAFHRLILPKHQILRFENRNVIHI
jgi:hypothetical protein